MIDNETYRAIQKGILDGKEYEEINENEVNLADLGRSLHSLSKRIANFEGSPSMLGALMKPWRS